MVKIIFSRTGKKKQAYFRVIALDKQKDPWGKSLEILGNYNPRSKELDIKIDRVKFWLEKGAQLSPTLNNLLITKKLIEGKKVHASNISKRHQVKLDAKAKAAKPAEAPAEKAAPAADKAPESK